MVQANMQSIAPAAFPAAHVLLLVLATVSLTLPSADLDLAAFPPLSRQEAPESRRARAQAYVSASALLKDRYTVGTGGNGVCGGKRPHAGADAGMVHVEAAIGYLDSLQRQQPLPPCPRQQTFCTDFENDIFQELWFEFVAHQCPSKRQAAARKLGSPGSSPQPAACGGDPTSASAAAPFAVPAAVLSARGIGSEADDRDMHPRLVAYLREKKAYVATLQAKDLGSGGGGGMGAALQSVLRQLMGPDAEDWGAQDIEVGRGEDSGGCAVV